jgi:hypothetical protein
VSDTIVNALLEALFACMVFLDESPDDIIDPDSTVRAMENAGSPLLRLSAEDRATLVGLIREYAGSITEPTWRRYVLHQPFALGLVEEET